MIIDPHEERRSPTSSAAAAAGVLATLFAFAIFSAGAVLSWRALDRATEIGPFLVDRLAGVLIVLTGFIATVVNGFAVRNLEDDPRARRFFAATTLVAMGTAATAAAGTVSAFVVAWIVTSAAVVLLIAHRDDTAAGRDARRRTLLALGAGDTALVVAAAALVATAGDVRLDAVADAAATVAGTSTGWVIGLLLVVAVLARCAQLPMPRWLPSTLAAPTPASALLHAGVVNAGALLLVRFAPMVTASTIAVVVLVAAAGATAVVAYVASSVRSDVKGSLAQSTSAQMGFMLLQCAVGVPGAALLHVVGHAMYKAAAFLGTGDAVRRSMAAIHQPRPTAVPRPAVRAVATAAVTVSALAGSVALTRPAVLDHPGGWLVVGFAGFTLANAVWAWLSKPPVSFGVAMPAAGAAATALAAAYLAAASAFDSFMWPAVSPATAGWADPSIVASGAVVVAGFVLAARRSPALRARAYSVVFQYAHVSTAAPAPARAATAPHIVDVRTPVLRSAW
ncbi:MAG TPA: proton-conducting transporter membrane subunit [Acidimicrobiales bacterium]|nr:proton-conducting transporter membrane subunit [Acidimicrobiales bacterium]